MKRFRWSVVFVLVIILCLWYSATAQTVAKSRHAVRLPLPLLPTGVRLDSTLGNKRIMGSGADSYVLTDSIEFSIPNRRRVTTVVVYQFKHKIVFTYDENMILIATQFMFDKLP